MSSLPVRCASAAAAAAAVVTLGYFATSGSATSLVGHSSAVVHAAATGPVPAVGATCVNGRDATQRALTLIATVDTGAAGAAGARTQLGTLQQKLQSYATGATDDVLQERLQSMSDALHAYLVAAGDRTSSEYPDVLQSVRGLLGGLPATCLISDGGFETSTTGWSATGTGAVLARVAGGHTGSWAAQVANSGSAASTVGVTSSGALRGKGRGSYTAGVWVRATAAGVPVTLTVERIAGTTVLSTQQATVTADATWRYVQATSLPVKTTDTTLVVTASASALPAGTAVQFDDASLSRH